MTEAVPRQRHHDGPRGLPLVGNQASFNRDSLGFLTTVHHEYGSLVRIPLLGRSVVGVFGPDEVTAVTAAYGESVEISMAGGWNFAALQTNVQGRGPLNSEGAEHIRFRKICTKALAGGSLRAYSSIVEELTTQQVDQWRAGMEIDLVPGISRIALRAFKYYMFGADVVAECPEINGAIDEYISIMESTTRFVGSSILPFDIPGLSNGRRLRARMAEVDRFYRRRLEDSSAEDRTFLGKTMAHEVEAATGQPDLALAREMMLQMYFAGISSVASTIVWCLLLVSLHPPVAKRLIDEMSAALGGRLPGRRDVTVLPYLDAVVKESMRLYPGSAYEFKRTTSDVEIDGHFLPAGSRILLAPWVTHRSNLSFQDPGRFDPHRFVDGDHYRPGAFLPWGTGDRSCIGKMLARQAINVTVAGILQRFRLDLVPGQRIDPDPGRFGIRLLPRPGVRVVLADQDGGEPAQPRVYGTVEGALASV
jgi:cytochrome P450